MSGTFRSLDSIRKSFSFSRDSRFIEKPATHNMFEARKVVEACQRQGARFSISMRLQASHRKLISAIPEERRTSIPYWREGAASVAEIAYAPFGLKRSYRMIIRRVEALADGQRLLPGVGYLHFAFITDRPGDMLELEADHRQHAVVENVIRDLKYGLALNHMPSGVERQPVLVIVHIGERIVGSALAVHGRVIARAVESDARHGGSYRLSGQI